MTNEIAERPVSGLPALTFTPSEITLIKDTYCKGSTEDEFKLFLYVCKHRRLNPLLRQIHAVKRWDAGLQREAMAIQTGIDGYRLIAERTKKYAPGPEPSFVEGKDGIPVSATASVKLRSEDGEWHTVSATAYYSEYVQKKKDGSVVAMWARMPHSQLAKCAEALAIRKAFPEDCSEIRTDDEMAQAGEPIDVTPKDPIKPPVEKAAAPATPPQSGAEDPNTFHFIPAVLGSKEDKRGKMRYSVKLPSGAFAGTYDAEHYKTLTAGKDDGRSCIVKTTVDGTFTNVIGVSFEAEA